MSGPNGSLPSNYRPTNCPNLTPPKHCKDSFNIFVGTLPVGITKEELEILVTPFGKVCDTYLMKETKNPWRCGFVSFEQYSSAAHAISHLNGFTMHERYQPLCVRFANPPRETEKSGSGTAPAAGYASSASSESAPKLALARAIAAAGVPNLPEEDGHTATPPSPSSLSSSLGHETSPGPSPASGLRFVPALHSSSSLLTECPTLPSVLQQHHHRQQQQQQQPKSHSLQSSSSAGSLAGAHTFLPAAVPNLAAAASGSALVFPTGPATSALTSFNVQLAELMSKQQLRMGKARATKGPP
ncbi:Flowering time control protein FCA, partial [Diplonema papillatum]